MKAIRIFSPLACMAFMLAAGTAAHATAISGTVWSGQSGNVPAINNLPGSGSVAATFSATSLDFCVQSTACTVPNSGTYTLAGFLSSNNNASGVTGVSYHNGHLGTNTLNNTLFEFTGMAQFTNGQTYNLGHDDGARLYVNGVQVYSDPGPTSFVSTPYTYTGATGDYSFNFLYGEVSGAPAVFETNLEGPLASTPEPSSFLLLGSGLLAAAGVVRRRLSV